jgi:regulator of sirC expression with transglutaminase-like and TPR domain
MSTPQDARRLFSVLVRRSDREINLAEAALLVAAGQGSEAHVEFSLARLDSYAQRVRASLLANGIDDPTSEPRATIEAINRVLFAEEGFRGNRDDYYDVENSYLHRVIDSKTGIPITLSIIYLEVARQVGIQMRGIGLPGHFVVGYWPDAGRGKPALIVDPFNEGQLLSIEDCAARMQAAYGMDVRFTTDWLQPVTNRQILARVLTNLKHIFNSLEDHRAALRVIDMLLIVEPDAVWELKERGLIYYRLGEFMLALGDLRRFIKHAPAGDETDRMKYYVNLVNRLLMSRN